MNTSTLDITLSFTPYGPPGPLNYGAFFLTFVLYAATVFSNLTLMLVIYFDSSLHKPMYIFLFNLAVNGLIGCSAVYPSIMKNLLNDAKTISLNLCLLQVFFLYMYGSCAYATLTVMAYDRYVSICKPLQYHLMMTQSKTWGLVSITYIFPLGSVVTQVFLTSRAALCEFKISKLLCDNLTVLNLACGKNMLYHIYGVILIIISVVLPLFLVILSYIKILVVCQKASGNARNKALSTCAPHLITFTNFTSATLFSVIYNRLNSNVSQEINTLITVLYILIPPLLLECGVSVVE